VKLDGILARGGREALGEIRGEEGKGKRRRVILVELQVKLGLESRGLYICGLLYEPGDQ